MLGGNEIADMFVLGDFARAKCDTARAKNVVQGLVHCLGEERGTSPQEWAGLINELISDKGDITWDD